MPSADRGNSVFVEAKVEMQAGGQEFPELGFLGSLLEVSFLASVSWASVSVALPGERAAGC